MKMKKTGFVFLIIMSVLLFSCAGRPKYKEDPSVPLAKLVASDMFKNYMVLQRDTPVPVWGTGHRGKTIQISFMDQVKTATADETGKWILHLDPVPAVTEPQELAMEYLTDPKIDLGRKIPEGRTFKDVLVGDVWLCSGQSNMEFGMAGIYDKEKEALDLEYPQIRVYLIYKHAQGVPRAETSSAWFPARRSSIFSGGWHGFSAVGFTFARKIYNETKVPIGVIQAAFGGSKIDAWIPPQELAGYPELDTQFKVWQKAEDYYHQELKKDPEAEHPFNIIGDNYSMLRPSTAYFGMIAPVVPYALKGILWYQGESDIGAFQLYTKRTEALITAFR
ncbi:MAG: sialate O-acetylesterase, partial [Spirochaetales bacterium]|nr:sialate O-acetylesterase [Spirochaetales bacterium]